MSAVRICTGLYDTPWFPESITGLFLQEYGDRLYPGGFFVVVTNSAMKNVLKRGYYKEIVQTVKHICPVSLLVALYLFAVQQGDTDSRIAFFRAICHFAAPVRPRWMNGKSMSCTTGPVWRSSQALQDCGRSAAGATSPILNRWWSWIKNTYGNGAWGLISAFCLKRSELC